MKRKQTSAPIRFSELEAKGIMRRVTDRKESQELIKKQIGGKGSSPSNGRDHTYYHY